MATLAKSLYSSDVEENAKLYARLDEGGGITAVLDSIQAKPEGNEELKRTRSALLVLANVCSNDVVGTEKADESRTRLRDGTQFATLLRCLFSDDEAMVCYAVAACQNACTSYEAAQAICDGGVLAHLEKLAEMQGSPIQEYAVGCLYNMKAALDYGAKVAAFADKFNAAAKGKVENAMRKWIARRRRQKMELAAKEAVAEHAMKG